MRNAFLAGEIGAFKRRAAATRVLMNAYVAGRFLRLRSRNIKPTGECNLLNKPTVNWKTGRILSVKTQYSYTLRTQ